MSFIEIFTDVINEKISHHRMSKYRTNIQFYPVDYAKTMNF
jgi:hypothetical protein